MNKRQDARIYRMNREGLPKKIIAKVEGIKDPSHVRLAIDRHKTTLKVAYERSSVPWPTITHNPRKSFPSRQAETFVMKGERVNLA